MPRACDDSGVGGKRWIILAGAVLASAVVVGVVLLTSRSSGVKDAAGVVDPTTSEASGQAGVAVPTQPIPTGPANYSDMDDLPELVPETEDQRSPGAGTNGASGSPPPSPPPQPPPSPPVQPSAGPCTISIYAGPIPGVPNIRVVVTSAPTVDALWATVTEGGKTLRGVIALAGGRGEQVVEGVSQAAQVSIYSDPSLAEPTLSCATR